MIGGYTKPPLLQALLKDHALLIGGCLPSPSWSVPPPLHILQAVHEEIALLL